MMTRNAPWQEIVDLDRKRHRNREAIRAIDSACKSHWAGDESKTWLAMGNSFFRLPAKKATELLKKGTESLMVVAVPWFVSFTFIFFAKTLSNLAVCYLPDDGIKRDPDMD